MRMRPSGWSARDSTSPPLPAHGSGPLLAQAGSGAPFARKRRTKPRPPQPPPTRMRPSGWIITAPAVAASGVATVTRPSPPPNDVSVAPALVKRRSVSTPASGPVPAPPATTMRPSGWTATASALENWPKMVVRRPSPLKDGSSAPGAAAAGAASASVAAPAASRCGSSRRAGMGRPRRCATPSARAALGVRRRHLDLSPPPLQRQPPPHHPGQPVRPGPQRRARHARRCHATDVPTDTPGRTRGPCGPRPAPSRQHPGDAGASSRRPRAARGTRRTSAAGAHRAVGVGVQDRRVRDVGLGEAGPQQVEPEPLVLRVGDVAERDRPPGAPRRQRFAEDTNVASPGAGRAPGRPPVHTRGTGPKNSAYSRRSGAGSPGRPR